MGDGRFITRKEIMCGKCSGQKVYLFMNEAAMNNKMFVGEPLIILDQEKPTVLLVLQVELTRLVEWKKCIGIFLHCSGF